MTVPAVEVIASRYRIVRELGRGGMGVVYLVEHVHTGDQLALKVLFGAASRNEGMIARFKREARAPARIRSENVVKVTDADVAPELDGAPFLVMELLDGEDLERHVNRVGGINPSEALATLGQIARVLDKAHGLGIVHRDLKPENIFLHRREDGTQVVKLLDFGISKIMGEGAGDIGSAGMTKTGLVLGTPLYMSPEQARAQSALIGPPADIWAMGLIAYRVLTGTIYWSADSIAQLMVQILSDPMPPPSHRFPRLPAAFDAWFARSCERDPAARWSTAGEQVQALALALGITTSGLPGTTGRLGNSSPPAAIASSAQNPPPTQPGSPSNAGADFGHSGAAVSRTYASRPGSRLGLAIGGVALALAVCGGLVVAIRAVRSPPGSASATVEETPAPTLATAVAAMPAPASAPQAIEVVPATEPPPAAASATTRAAIAQAPYPRVIPSASAGPIKRPAAAAATATAKATSAATVPPAASQRFDPSAP